MIAVVATLRAKAGQSDALGSVLAQAAERVRADEPGCSYYQPCQSTDDPNLFKVFEIYDSADAIAAHREAPHFQPLKEAFGTLLAEPPTVERLTLVG